MPNHSDEATFSCDDLVAELKASAPVRAESSGVVRLSIAESGITLSCRAEAFGEYEGHIDASATASGRIAFNGTYLEEMTKQIGSEIKLHFGAAGKPAMWTDQDPDFYCVIMPMKVQW